MVTDSTTVFIDPAPDTARATLLVKLVLDTQIRHSADVPPVVWPRVATLKLEPAIVTLTPAVPGTFVRFSPVKADVPAAVVAAAAVVIGVVAFVVEAEAVVVIGVAS